MQHDLLTISREDLRFLLKTARDEVAKYNLCCRKIENCKVNSLTGTKQEYGITIGCGTGCGYIVVAVVVWFIVIVLACADTLDCMVDTSIIVISFFLPALLAVFLGLKWYDHTVKDMEKSKIRLQELQKEKEKAVNEFEALLFIPSDYRSEYALATMLKYIDNKRACSWKEVTNMYETHLHRKTMEETAQLSLEQSMLQTAIQEKTRRATNVAAAGAVVSALGIWLRDRK